jgi:hypothetical protein
MRTTVSIDSRGYLKIGRALAAFVGAELVSAPPAEGRLGRLAALRAAGPTQGRPLHQLRGPLSLGSIRLTVPTALTA